MSTYPLNPLALDLSLSSLFLAFICRMLRRIRRSGEIAFLASVQTVACRTDGSGKCYAKLPFITSSDGLCPLLRNILVDELGCREITEITGGGDTWWDFTYRGKRFTCKLLPKSCHGSEFYRLGLLPPDEREDRLLRRLVHKISWHAALKTGLTCPSLLRLQI